MLNMQIRNETAKLSAIPHSNALLIAVTIQEYAYYIICILGLKIAFAPQLLIKIQTNLNNICLSDLLSFEQKEWITRTITADSLMRGSCLG